VYVNRNIEIIDKLYPEEGMHGHISNKEQEGLTDIPRTHTSKK
jgi:hypothetical protein